MGTNQKMKIENVLQPGKTYTVDAAKYEAMKQAFLAVVPKSTPGITPLDVSREVRPLLPQDLFPGGEKAGWWVKAVQLDLEAKSVIARAATPPVRLHRL
jgi:hypothetical protein